MSIFRDFAAMRESDRVQLIYITDEVSAFLARNSAQLMVLCEYWGYDAAELIKHLLEEGKEKLSTEMQIGQEADRKLREATE